MHLGFLWDDYIFLSDALAGRARAFLPDSSDAFYRPLPRGLWFGLLGAAGPWGTALAHVGNGLFLAGVVALLAGLDLRLAGPRAGFAAGAFFAGFGALPFLAGWASGCQDLLALLFLLGAAHLELSRRTGRALLCAALALLSKETAAAAFPALVLAPWLLRGDRGRTGARALRYGVLLAGWAAIHPGIRTLLERGFRAGATGYVGFSDPDRWLPSLLRYAEVLVNWPVTGFGTSWPRYATAAAALAVAILLAGVWALGAAKGRSTGPGRGTRLPGDAPRARDTAPRGRVLLFAAALALPPLLPAVLLLDVWSPYYVVLAAAGLALAAGIILLRVPRVLLALALTAFLVLGVWSRGADLGAAVPDERWLRDTDGALRRVRASLDRLLPDVPRGSRLLAAVFVPTSRRVAMHLFFYQAPRVWRRDPSLLTVRPDWRPPEDGPEFLLGVTPDRSVFVVDPATRRVQTYGMPPDTVYVRLTLRDYARGLALDGRTDRGVALLKAIRGGSPLERAVDLRIAAMLLAADARRGEAGDILEAVPAIPREPAIVEITSLLMDAPGGSRWDEPALFAFGFAPDDAEVCRVLMQNFVWGHRPAAARRFAERLLRLRPADPDPVAVLRRIATMKGPDAFAFPAPPDVVAQDALRSPQRGGP